MRNQLSFGVWERAAFGPLAAIVPVLTSVATTAVGAASSLGSAALGALGGVTGVGGAAAGAAGGAGAGAGGILSSLGGISSLLGTGLSVAQAFNRPKAPTAPPAPQAPTFASGFRAGANSSLAALSPSLAQGGTNTTGGGSPLLGASGGKSLLGQ